MTQKIMVFQATQFWNPILTEWYNFNTNIKNWCDMSFLTNDIEYNDFLKISQIKHLVKNDNLNV
jgi:hypothetical protein